MYNRGTPHKHTDSSAAGGLSPDEVRAYLAPHRKVCQTSEVAGWPRLDEMLFKISAGGMALSLTLLAIVKTSISAGSMTWLYLAWGSWGLCLIVLLFSIVGGQYSLRAQIDHIDKGNYYKVKRPGGTWGPLIGPMNWFAIASCVVGLMFLAIFAFANVGKGASPKSDSVEIRIGGEN